MTLGEQIKAARENRNLSQEELAEQMGVSRQAVSKWENDASIPQGANRDMLSMLLDMEFTKQETQPPKKTGILWIGSAIVAVLLLAVVGIQFYYRTRVLVSSAEAAADTGNTVPEPSLTDVQFYDDDQERVGDTASWYNSADIDSILLQWTGDTPEQVKILFAPAGADTSEQTELVATKNILEDTYVVLLSADSLKDRPQGHIYFELDFGDSIIASEKFNLFYEADSVEMEEQPDADAAEILAYIMQLEDGILIYDVAEWVDVPGRRAAELGLEENDAGFLVYNEVTMQEECALAEECICIVLDWANSFEPKEVSAEELSDTLSEREGMDIPYHLKIRGNEVVEIREQYLP